MRAGEREMRYQRSEISQSLRKEGSGITRQEKKESADESD